MPQYEGTTHAFSLSFSVADVCGWRFYGNLVHIVLKRIVTIAMGKITRIILLANLHIEPTLGMRFGTFSS